MAIKVTCPKCNNRASASEKAAGRAARCPHCGNHFLIPSASPSPTTGPEAGVAGAPDRTPVDIRLPSVGLDDWEDIEDHIDRRRRDREDDQRQDSGGVAADGGGGGREGTPGKGKVARGLGIASAVLGAAALPFAMLPGLGPLSLLLSGLGVLLGFAGGGICLAHRERGVGLPVAGAAVSALAVLVGLLWPGPQAGAGGRPDGRRATRPAILNEDEQRPKEGVAPPGQPEDKALPGPSWVPHDKAAKLGDLQVQIAKVVIGKVPLNSTTPNTTSQNPLLMIQINLLNTNPTRKVDYDSWAGRGAPSAGGVATLSDNLGNSYKRASFGPGAYPAGAVEGAASIYPDKAVTDVLVFELPLKAATHIDLELPAKNVGAGGAIRFRIPASSVAQPVPGSDE
jgi:hypothetical protein